MRTLASVRDEPCVNRVFFQLLSMAEWQEFDPRWLGACISEREWHFHRQLLRRYGVVLGVGQFSKIVREIRRKRARLVQRRGKEGAIYSVRIDGVDQQLYILAVKGVPRTAWPARYVERLEKKLYGEEGSDGDRGWSWPSIASEYSTPAGIVG